MGISDLVATSTTAHAVMRALKHSVKMRSARRAAQAELQDIYDHMAIRLRLPALPVHLPLRKKFRRRGAAVFYEDPPWEIRVYPIRVSPLAHPVKQTAEDIVPCGPVLLSEILLHEIAHIHSAYFTGERGHGVGFVRSYCMVEKALLEAGFGHMLRADDVRFSGCPAGSAAAALHGTPRLRGGKPANRLCVS